MYLCNYVCVYLCIYIHIHVCIYVRSMHVYACLCMYVRTMSHVIVPSTVIFLCIHLILYEPLLYLVLPSHLEGISAGIVLISMYDLSHLMLEGSLCHTSYMR